MKQRKQKQNKVDLDYLLSQLSAEEPKQSLTCSVVAKGLAKNKYYRENAIQILQDMGDNFGATQVALRRGDIDKAIQIYESSNGDKLLLSMAAKSAERKGDLKKATEIYERMNKIEPPLYRTHIARLTAKQGDIDKAISMYEQCGLIDLAAQLAQKKYGIDKTIEVFERNGWYGRAAPLAEKAKDKDRARQFYVKALEEFTELKNDAAVAFCAKKLGDNAKAEEMYGKARLELERQGRYDRLVILARRMKDKERVKAYETMARIYK